MAEVVGVLGANPLIGAANGVITAKLSAATGVSASTSGSSGSPAVVSADDSPAVSTGGAVHAEVAVTLAEIAQQINVTGLAGIRGPAGASPTYGTAEPSGGSHGDIYIQVLT